MRNFAHPMPFNLPSTWFAALAALLLLSGCASTTHRAPVEERTAATRPARTASGPGVALPSAAAAATAIPAPVEPAAAKPLPGAENAGKPGYYTVKPGDTLIRVGLENGQNWRDIARWSGLENPNAIEVGQVLRVVPPTADANGVVVRPVAPVGRVDGRPLEGKAGAPLLPPGATAPAAPTSGTAASRDPEEDIAWGWPATGLVVAPFDDNKNKGLAITGKPGDAVLAAADGRVVYAGSGLRGYGNLVIVKHNTTYLTAYAHNQMLLVKEDQIVRRGQKIAEMGSSDAERVQLHFEIRRLGKPIDPARLLPPR